MTPVLKRLGIISETQSFTYSLNLPGKVARRLNWRFVSLIVHLFPRLPKKSQSRSRLVRWGDQGKRCCATLLSSCSRTS